MGTKKQKHGRMVGRFFALPHHVLKSEEWVALPSSAKGLLLDVGVQLNGSNNGDLSIAFKLMQPRGWSSETTLHKAKRALLDGGFLYETRKGQRPNLCSLFALAWLPLNVNDKFDIGVLAAYRPTQFSPLPLEPKRVRCAGGQKRGATAEMGVAALA